MENNKLSEEQGLNKTKVVSYQFGSALNYQSLRSHNGKSSITAEDVTNEGHVEIAQQMRKKNIGGISISFLPVVLDVFSQWVETGQLDEGKLKEIKPEIETGRQEISNLFNAVNPGESFDRFEMKRPFHTVAIPYHLVWALLTSIDYPELNYQEYRDRLHDLMTDDDFKPQLK